MRKDSERLNDVLDAIAQIEKYTQQGREAFEGNELIQVWILHHLQIIGEAINNVSDELQQRFPKIPWPQIVGMRNIIIHKYFGVKLGEIWDTVQRNLPELKREVEVMLAELGE